MGNQMAEPKKAQAAKTSETAKNVTPAKTGAVAPPAETNPLEEMKKFKPKKQMAVPDEMLNDAKSYDDKLVLVKMLTEKERNRMVLIIKNLLK
jgi:hypothetical protein